MRIGQFELANDEKIERAKHGSMTRGGVLTGGVGDLPEEHTKEEKDTYEAKLLAEYDRLGGLVLKDGIKVCMGTFYDFAKRTPQKEYNMKFEENIDGYLTQVTEEEAVALKTAREKVEELKAKKVKKKK
jgi:hypothetical protein